MLLDGSTYYSWPTPAKIGATVLAVGIVALFVASMWWKRESPTDRQELARRGRQLSSEILEFLTEIRESEPNYFRLGYEQHAEASLLHNRRWMTAYSRRFSARAIVLVEDMKKAGLPVDSFLPHLAANPTNPLGVQEVGQQIGALAEMASSN